MHYFSWRLFQYKVLWIYRCLFGKLQFSICTKESLLSAQIGQLFHSIHPKIHLAPTLHPRRLHVVHSVCIHAYRPHVLQPVVWSLRRFTGGGAPLIEAGFTQTAGLLNTSSQQNKRKKTDLAVDSDDNFVVIIVVAYPSIWCVTQYNLFAFGISFTAN